MGIDSHWDASHVASLATASATAASIAAAVVAGGSDYCYTNSNAHSIGRAFVSLLEGKLLRFDSTLLLAPSAHLPLAVPANQLLPSAAHAMSPWGSLPASSVANAVSTTQTQRLHSTYVNVI